MISAAAETYLKLKMVDEKSLRDFSIELMGTRFQKLWITLRVGVLGGYCFANDILAKGQYDIFVCDEYDISCFAGCDIFGFAESSSY